MYYVKKKTKKKLSHEEGDCFLRQLGSLGACDFRLEVMRGSELASILLMTSLLVIRVPNWSLSGPHNSKVVGQKSGGPSGPEVVLRHTKNIMLYIM